MPPNGLVPAEASGKAEGGRGDKFRHSKAGHLRGGCPVSAPMNVSVALWGYLFLLLAGGLLGFLKARSRASLVASVGCAAPIGAVALGWLPLVVARVELGFLAVFFGMRWAKTGKPMPGAPMIALTLAMLALSFFLKP